MNQVGAPWLSRSVASGSARQSCRNLGSGFSPVMAAILAQRETSSTIPPAFPGNPTVTTASPPRPSDDRLWHVLTLLGLLALSLLYLRPIWRLFGTHIEPDTGDPVFNLYILKWGAHQIRLGM